MRSGSRCVVSSLSVEKRTHLAEVEIHVVTPMFGGGAVPGIVDAEQPVNGKSIRGALRFWWRACHGHQFESADELFKAEAAIWGQSAKKGVDFAPSAVDIKIVDLNPGKPFPPPELKTPIPPGKRNPVDPWQNQDSSEYPAYALFPFKKQDDPYKAPQSGQSGVSFTLRLFDARRSGDRRNDDLSAAVNSALWAWIMFGGIGARTRRGCGALWSSSFKLNLQNVPQFLREQAAVYGDGDPDQKTLSIPTLRGSSALLLKPSGTQYADHIPAWIAAVNIMREFRQGKDIGRNGLYGRSRWPEADSIRNLIASNDPGKTFTKHPPENSDTRYFPRLAFGAPIVFHFKDDDDPADHTLESGIEGATRMASPFILKPLAISKTKSLPLVLMLNVPSPTKIPGASFVLKYKQKVIHTLDLPDDVLSKDRSEPVVPINSFNSADPREAFLNFIRNEWNGRLQEGEL